MLRRIFKPRLWWTLLFPFFFYLTREVDTRQEGSISIQEYESKKSHYELEGFNVFGASVAPNTYQVLNFIAITCVVMGCYSIGKSIISKQ